MGKTISSKENLVSIESLAAGGAGVGRIGGKVVFVPLTAPGDLARVEITSDRHSFYLGRLRDLVEASEKRASPSCPLFGSCGGCQWQHLRYGEQLLAKGELLRNALCRIGGNAETGPIDVIPSPLAYGYRHRCRIQVAHRRGKIVCGFFRAGSHEVIPAGECPVLHESLRRLLPHLARILSAQRRALRDLRGLQLASDWSGNSTRISFQGTVAQISPPWVLREELARVAKDEGVELLFPGKSEKGLLLGEGERDLVSTGETFTQVNLRQNVNLVREVLSLAGTVKGETVLDLYCGIGNLSIPLAEAGATVVGVDSNPPSIRCARENAARLGVENLSFQGGKAEDAVTDLAGKGRAFGLVVMNPPRSGARETVRGLRSLSAPRVVMVSCDPATFARDTALLAEGGYRLETLRALDLFPQTFHVETVALFVR
jgi:23S rRNA (uracil1939-C5)-methyltransferase